MYLIFIDPSRSLYEQVPPPSNICKTSFCAMFLTSFHKPAWTMVPTHVWSPRWRQLRCSLILIKEPGCTTKEQTCWFQNISSTPPYRLFMISIFLASAYYTSNLLPKATANLDLYHADTSGILMISCHVAFLFIAPNFLLSSATTAEQNLDIAFLLIDPKLRKAEIFFCYPTKKYAKSTSNL